MPLDITQLRAWTHSWNHDGASSASNCRFLDGLLRDGSLVSTPGMTITYDQTLQQDTPCIRLHFHLPLACQSNGTRSIPVLVPNACLGTGIYQTQQIFYALIEEVIGWLAYVGPKHTLVRLYLNNNGEPLPRSYSSGWMRLHNSFMLFITSVRESHHQFPGQGRMSGDFGVIEVTQARTSSEEISADYIVTMTLGNGQRMRIFLPRSVAQLPQDWMLDWLEVQNEFSTQA